MICRGIPYYYIISNGEKVPAALLPDASGKYFKEDFLCKKTPEFFMHMAVMENLGGDRFVWPPEPEMEWINITDIVKRLEQPEYCLTESGIPLFIEFASLLETIC